MTFIELTHANTNQPIVVPTALVFAFYYSDAHKCTLVLSSGGAMLPAKESVNEVKAKMQTSGLPGTNQSGVGVLQQTQENGDGGQAVQGQELRHDQGNTVQANPPAV